MGIVVLDGQSPANVLSIIKLRTFYTRERAALYLTASMEPYVSHLGTTSNDYIITRLTLETGFCAPWFLFFGCLDF